MANIAPTVLFASYTSDGTNLTIPLASIPVLNSAEAHATTGDGREVARALIERITLAIEGLSPELRPTKMTATRGSIVGLSSQTVRRTYTFSFDESLTPTSNSIIAEPA